MTGVQTCALPIYVQQCVEDMVAPFLYRRLVTQGRITRPQVDELATALLARWGG